MQSLTLEALFESIFRVLKHATASGAVMAATLGTHSIMCLSSIPLQRCQLISHQSHPHQCPWLGAHEPRACGPGLPRSGGTA